MLSYDNSKGFHFEPVHKSHQLLEFTLTNLNLPIIYTHDLLILIEILSFLPE